MKFFKAENGNIYKSETEEKFIEFAEKNRIKNWVQIYRLDYRQAKNVKIYFPIEVV